MRLLTKIAGPSGHNPAELEGGHFSPFPNWKGTIDMPHLSSTAFALQTAMGSTVPPGHHPSPDQLRTILQESTATVMSGHANYHQNSAFCRDTQKLPLDKLVDFIFSMQSTNLPIQLASYAGFCEENQFANSALSEARSKLRSDFFKDIFDQVMSRLLLTGACEDR